MRERQRGREGEREIIFHGSVKKRTPNSKWYKIKKREKNMFENGGWRDR